MKPLVGAKLLCAKYRPVFALSPGELGRCTIFEATLPLKPGARPVGKPACRTSPLVKEKINAQVDKVLQQGLIEERPSTWGSPMIIVAKADGYPRFRVNSRHTLNLALERKL